MFRSVSSLQIFYHLYLSPAMPSSRSAEEMWGFPSFPAAPERPPAWPRAQDWKLFSGLKGEMKWLLGLITPHFCWAGQWEDWSRLSTVGFVKVDNINQVQHQHCIITLQTDTAPGHAGAFSASREIMSDVWGEQKQPQSVPHSIPQSGVSGLTSDQLVCLSQLSWGFEGSEPPEEPGLLELCQLWVRLL